ncbi:MAG TPA: hypothetical protein VHN80_22320 [Kineosporiaceae bacterium]|jgi:hypothetical protein|nr:hypothetical protein [Kineosporiaceae bacterium]
MVVLLGDLDDAVIAKEATRREWLAARLLAARLDRSLADGASPESSVLLALRAQYLVRPRTRRTLATTLQRILIESVRPPRRSTSPLPLCARQRVVAVEREFQELIGRLSAPCPVPACGVAKVRVLLTEGSGPLYRVGQSTDLRSTVLAAVGALEPLDHF